MIIHFKNIIFQNNCILKYIFKQLDTFIYQPTKYTLVSSYTTNQTYYLYHLIHDHLVLDHGRFWPAAGSNGVLWDCIWLENVVQFSHMVLVQGK